MALSDELAKLQELHQRGALTDDEFSRAKARLLEGAASSTEAPWKISTRVAATTHSCTGRECV